MTVCVMICLVINVGLSLAESAAGNKLCFQYNSGAVILYGGNGC